MKRKLIKYQKKVKKMTIPKKLTKIFTLSLLFLIILGTKSFAQRVDGTYYDWTVFELDEAGKGKKCYIASFPKNSVGNYKGKREPYILITKFKNKKVEEVSVFSGYEYKLNSDIFVSVDGKQYRMFTKDDIAWAKTPEQDKEMIEKIIAGQEIKIRTESAKGAYSVDTYSLKGATKAYKRMRDLCAD